jgi:hypothetical protein
LQAVKRAPAPCRRIQIVQTFGRFHHPNHVDALACLADPDDVRVLTFDGPLLGLPIVNVGSKNGRINSLRGNAFNQLIVGNLIRRRGVAHRLFSIVNLAMPVLLAIIPHLANPQHGPAERRSAFAEPGELM